MSLAHAYVTLQASLLLLFGFLALRKERTGTLGILGWMWAVMACYLFSYHWLYVHKWTFLRDYGSYTIEIAAMLWLLASHYLRPRPYRSIGDYAFDTERRGRPQSSCRDRVKE